MEIFNVPFIPQAGENVGEIFGIVAYLCPESCFAADERRGVGEGEEMTIVLFGVPETRDEIIDVADCVSGLRIYIRNTWLNSHWSGGFISLDYCGVFV